MMLATLVSSHLNSSLTTEISIRTFSATRIIIFFIVVVAVAGVRVLPHSAVAAAGIAADTAAPAFLLLRLIPLLKVLGIHSFAESLTLKFILGCFQIVAGFLQEPESFVTSDLGSLVDQRQNIVHIFPGGGGQSAEFHVWPGAVQFSQQHQLITASLLLIREIFHLLEGKHQLIE